MTIDKKDFDNLLSLENLLKNESLSKPAGILKKDDNVPVPYSNGVKITNMEPETPEHAFDNSITKKQVEEIDAQNKGLNAVENLMQFAEQLKAFSGTLKMSPIQIGTMEEELKKLSGKQVIVDADDDTFSFSKMMAASVLNIPEFKFALRQDLEESGHTEFLPTRSEDKATGWDVRCANSDGVVIRPFEYVKIDLGIRAFCPEGYWYKLVPRSSTFAKKYLHCLYGVIDETYENTLIFAAVFIPNFYMPIESKTNSELKIDFGERIGQIIPVKRQEAKMTLVSNKEIEELYAKRNGQRKECGFGSSGDK